MNSNLNKYLKRAALFLCLSTMFVQCKKDIFDKRDLTGVDPRIWDDENSTTLYINKIYELTMPNWPGAGSIHNTSDEMNNAEPKLLYGQLTDDNVTDIASGSANNDATNKYYLIRRINLAIEGIEGSKMPVNVKATLKGQAYFCRAFVYFNLVKLYGGVPLVLTPLDLNTDTLDIPRAKTSVCIKQIVRDLDSCYGLPPTWTNFGKDGGRITLEAARALKGKVLMYWASPQFNPNDDQARWQEAYDACKDAYEKGDAEGFKLLTDYSKIFTTEQGNSERILWRTLDATSVNPAKGTNIEAQIRPISETASGSGSYQPTWNLVKAFTMKDGLPIGNPSSAYTYNETVFWLNRDPRFQASVSYNGDNWPLSGKPNRRQWNYTNSAEEKSKPSSTGFYSKRFSNPSLSPTAAVYNSNSAGGSGMDWIEMRFAEVMLNYAECANAVGKLDEAKNMVRLIRKRAGIIQGNHDYGLDIATNRQSMDDLIMNERMVEFNIEAKRYDDLRRTRRFHLLTGQTRQGYRWDLKAPYGLVKPATNANPATIYIETTYDSGVTPRDTINFNNPGSVQKVFNTSFIPLDGNNVINFPQTYYFYPLPRSFKNSSVKIEQTMGWGGTFDPLQ